MHSVGLDMAPLRDGVLCLVVVKYETVNDTLQVYNLVSVVIKLQRSVQIPMLADVAGCYQSLTMAFEPAQ